MSVQVEKIHSCTGHNAALYALTPGRSDRHFISAGGDGWIVEWDLDQPEFGKLLASVENQVFSLCTLPGQFPVVAGNMNGGLHWINLANPEFTRNIQHHKSGVYALESIGNWLYSAGGDGLLTRWDAWNGRVVESLQLSHQSLRTLAFSAKRSEIAVAGTDRSIYFLDSETLQIRRVLKNAHLNSIFTVSYSPDSRYLLSGGRDAMLRVWGLDSGDALISEQPAHYYTINHLVFAPDAACFATASRDRTIKIWDARTFELLKVLDAQRFGAHTRSVNRLLWMKDCLISCGDDQQAVVWKITEQ